MKLNRLSVNKLYGKFSTSIKLDNRLNILVGINGSGKTTLLNCIDWMLRPDFTKLATTPFLAITLDFTYKGKKYSLEATQNEGHLFISEKLSGLFANPIVIDLIRPPEKLRSEAEVNHFISIYRRLFPELKDRALWKFLVELPQPLTITLDRSITAETEDTIFSDLQSQTKQSSSAKTKKPIEKVSEVTRARYAGYREQIYILNEKLKMRLVQSAFREPFQRPRPRQAKQISISDISKLEAKATTLLSASLGDTSPDISRYFASAKEFVRSFGKDDNLRAFFWSQYRQIGDFAEAFDEYEKLAAQAYSTMGTYLKAVNSFLLDSGKHIGFDEQDGTLAFQFTKEGQPSGPFTPLERLSSGERQIVTLLTFAAFVLQTNHIFVVDEPELSLHPKWQANFIEALIAQAPERTQIILATHSPEIVGGNVDSCIILENRGSS